MHPAPAKSPDRPEDKASDPLTELLRRSPNCRVTITSRPARRKPKRPKPQVGDLRVKGWSIQRYDFQWYDGCYVVGPRGGHRYEWKYVRDSTKEERKTRRVQTA